MEGFRDWGFDKLVAVDEEFVVKSDGVIFLVRFLIILGRKVFLAINEA